MVGDCGASRALAPIRGFTANEPPLVALPPESFPATVVSLTRAGLSSDALTTTLGAAGSAAPEDESARGRGGRDDSLPLTSGWNAAGSPFGNPENTAGDVAPADVAPTDVAGRLGLPELLLGPTGSRLLRLPVPMVVVTLPAVGRVTAPYTTPSQYSGFLSPQPARFIVSDAPPTSEAKRL